MTTIPLEIPATERSSGPVARAGSALMALPDHERHAIGLVLYRRMSCRAAAGVLGTTEELVRRWLRAGLGRIGLELGAQPTPV